jgi:hypothetical protein
MDALRRDAAILSGLLLAGRGIAISLGLIAFTAFMIFVMPEEKRLNTLQACVVFSIVCLLTLAASRVRMYCESAGRLGIPRHALAVRRTQCILIGLFTALPAAFALWSGVGYHAVVVLVGATAFAIYISEALPLVVIAAFALKGLAATGVDIWALLFGTPGSIVILAVSTWGIARWLQLPLRLEAEAAIASSLTFADTAHEGVATDELDEANEAFERHLDDVLVPRSPHALSPRRLWVGLGHDPSVNWRVNAIGISIALAITVVLHFWKHASWDLGVYLAVSALFATFVFGRFNHLQEVWRRSQGEQSVLVLSAYWPSRAAFKVTLLRSIWTGIPELIAGWLLFSGVVLATRWIDWNTVVLTAIGLATALVASLAIFLSYFAYSRLPRTNFLQMAYLLTAFAGIATMLTSIAHGFLPGTLIGAGLVLAPAAVAFLAFFLRPALFPVQIDDRK